MKLPLAKALRISQRACVAFIGAGGKSTTLFKLAREYSTPVIVTATTHLGTWQTSQADAHIIANDVKDIEPLDFDKLRVVLVTAGVENNRTKPLNAELLDRLSFFCRTQSFPLLVEADGSRQRPIKAWDDHEPPIPEFAEHVVQIVGMNGLGMPLTHEFVHRAEIFSKLSGLEIGEPVGPDALKKVLTNKAGGLKNIPPGAIKTLIFNQADTLEKQSIARKLADELSSHYPSILVASMKEDLIHAVYEPIAGIILAAGESSRYGKTKQLLDWKGEPFVRVVAKNAIRAGFSPVVVVTGAHAGQVEAAIQDLNVAVLKNNEWRTGQGSSIRTGVQNLPKWCGGAIFLLADQPHVDTSVLRALREKHAETLSPIIAPMVLDQRANPVLFDRVTFPDLMNITGDTGGRAIFHKHRVAYLPWHDGSLLVDVDTPEQYQRLISNGDS